MRDGQALATEAASNLGNTHPYPGAGYDKYVVVVVDRFHTVVTLRTTLRFEWPGAHNDLEDLDAAEAIDIALAGIDSLVSWRLREVRYDHGADGKLGRKVATVDVDHTGDGERRYQS